MRTSRVFLPAGCRNTGGFILLLGAAALKQSAHLWLRHYHSHVATEEPQNTTCCPTSLMLLHCDIFQILLEEDEGVVVVTATWRIRLLFCCRFPKRSRRGELVSRRRQQRCSVTWPASQSWLSAERRHAPVPIPRAGPERGHVPHTGITAHPPNWLKQITGEILRC